MGALGAPVRIGHEAYIVGLANRAGFNYTAPDQDPSEEPKIALGFRSVYWGAGRCRETSSETV